MIKLIALDLDGTLAIDNHQVSTLTREALDKLHQDGVEVVIATGRRYRTTRYVIKNLGFEVFAVCNGGALVKAPDQTTVYRESFSIIPILEIARELKLTLFAQRDAHQYGGADFIIDSVPTWNEITSRHIDINQDWHHPPPSQMVPGDCIACYLDLAWLASWIECFLFGVSGEGARPVVAAGVVNPSPHPLWVGQT